MKSSKLKLKLVPVPLLRIVNGTLFSTAIFALFRYPITIEITWHDLLAFLFLAFIYFAINSVNLVCILGLLTFSILGIVSMVSSISPFNHQMSSSGFLTLLGSIAAIIYVFQKLLLERVWKENRKDLSTDSIVLALSLLPAMYFGRGTPLGAFKYIVTGNEDNLVWLNGLAKTIGSNGVLQLAPDITFGSGTVTGSILFFVQSIFSFALPNSFMYDLSLNPFVLQIVYGFILIVLIWTTMYWILAWLMATKKHSKSVVATLFIGSGIALYSTSATLMTFGHLSALVSTAFVWAMFGVRNVFASSPERKRFASYVLVPTVLGFGAALAWWPIFPAIGSLILSFIVLQNQENRSNTKRLTTNMKFKHAAIGLSLFLGVFLLAPIDFDSALKDFSSSILIKGGADPISFVVLAFAFVTLVLMLKSNAGNASDVNELFFQKVSREVGILFGYASFVFLMTVFVTKSTGSFGQTVQFDFYAASKLMLIVFSVLLPIGVLILGEKVLDNTKGYILVFTTLSAFAILFMQLGSPGSRVMFPISIHGKSPGWASAVFKVAKSDPEKVIVCLNTIKGSPPDSYDMYLCTRMAGGLTGMMMDQQGWAQKVNLQKDFGVLDDGDFSEGFFDNLHIIVSEEKSRHTGDRDQREWSHTLPWNKIEITGLKTKP